MIDLSISILVIVGLIIIYKVCMSIKIENQTEIDLSNYINKKELEIKVTELVNKINSVINKK